MKGTALLRATAVSALLALGAAQAGVYKWVDEQGNVHYGDRPDGQGAKALQVPEGRGAAPPPATDSRAERQRRLLDAMETDRIERREARRQQAAAAEDRERRCHYARDRLRRFEAAARLYDLDGQGERRILSDRERALALDRAKADIKKWCG